MLTAPDFMRELKRGEEAEVAALLDAAFGRPDESQLVGALRKSGAMAGEMVLPMAGGIVGYAALSAMRAPKGWLCLAPVAIRPDVQRRGYGRRLVGMIAQWATMSGATVVVLGDPAFYARCGFAPLSAGIRSPYPTDHTLTAGPAGTAATELVYPKAFG
ncbi:GNAT family N-acetyltransferase [Celeribacter indicus]|uniref:Acetyltransferase n=1 Tax=Celeribacter indicus TaxID=1208324 RepID=A0A0B5E7T0_9RHOB|nr:N-acetyltransferase [Celeribacter indicus]AJE48352.1 acetyltransferase [Celeribacter indicus]SDW73606.1 putative acetyltransferase [Celeribacter indicus]